MCQHHYIKASEIEFTKTNSKAHTPQQVEDIMIDTCAGCGYQYLGFKTWAGCTSRIGVMCPQGHVYDVSYTKFVNAGRRCRECHGTAKLTNDKAIAAISAVCGEHVLVGIDGGEMKGGTTKIKMRCPKGHEYSLSYNSFIHNNTRCLVCSPTAKMTNETIIERIDSVRGEHEIVCIVGENKGAQTKIKMRCPKGHEYETTYTIFYHHGCRCGECRAFTSSDIIANVKANALEGYTVIGICEGYTNTTNVRIKMMCPNGHEYIAAYKHATHGHGCPTCSPSGYDNTKAGYLYVQHVPDVNAIKFGITNRTPEKRMMQHARGSKLNHTLVWAFRFDSGDKAREVENYIKRKWKDKTKFVSKEVMPDGYTETLPADMMHTFLKEVKNMCNMVRV
ncbi:hypothetical protein OJ364_004212 [Salmonella enterica]|nr:hypothetical protein [Salmonella enterica]